VVHGGGDLAGASVLVEEALDLGRALREPDLEAQAQIVTAVDDAHAALGHRAVHAISVQQYLSNESERVSRHGPSPQAIKTQRVQSNGARGRVKR